MSTGPAGEPKHRIPPYTKREPSARRVRVWPLRIGGAGTSLLSQRMAAAFAFGCFCGLVRNIISRTPFSGDGFPRTWNIDGPWRWDTE